MAKLYNGYEFNRVNLGSKRSRFTIPDARLLTLNSGQLIPFSRKTILPGDTVACKFAAVVRSLTPLAPTMDNAFVDLYWFFTPYRITWVHFPQFIGANDPTKGPWSSPNQYHIPKIAFTVDSWSGGYESRFFKSTFTYLGYPAPFKFVDPNDTSKGYTHFGYKANSLPFRAVLHIYNEYFIDENTQTPLNDFFDRDSDLEQSDLAGTSELPVNRFKDYIYSLLPAPQRGDAVNLPLIGDAPVVTGDVHPGIVGGNPVYFYHTDTGSHATGELYLGNEDVSGQQTGAVYSRGGQVDTGSINNHPVAPANLYAKMENVAGITVNRLRELIGVQLYQERLGVGGGRFREIIKSFFNVTIADNTVQVPEYLGGKRIPINMTTVLQTAAGTGGASGVLGNTGAMSNTSDSDDIFVKSFQEWGELTAVMCIRTSNSYSDYLERDLFMDNVYDLPWPQLEHIGEQGVYKKEFTLQGDEKDDEILGYAPRYSNWKSGRKLLCGFFSPRAGDLMLNAYTYHIGQSASPVLNSDFMKQSKDCVGKTLTADSDYQFFADIQCNYTFTRILSVNGTPSSLGLYKA